MRWFFDAPIRRSFKTTQITEIFTGVSPSGKAKDFDSFIVRIPTPSVSCVTRHLLLGLSLCGTFFTNLTPRSNIQLSTERRIGFLFSKLNTGVSPSGKAKDFDSFIVGSNPATPANKMDFFQKSIFVYLYQA